MRQFLILTLISLSMIAMPASAKDVVQGPVYADVLNVIDGDTLNVRAHTWVSTHIETKVKIRGIDTPEIKNAKCEEEKTLGKKAAEEVVYILEKGPVILTKIEHGKYANRVLANVQTFGRTDIAQHLIVNKLARPYDGGKRESWCEEDTKDE